MERTDVSAEVLEPLRSICLALPETTEEQAWAGTRWMIRASNFAHAVMIDDGWPPAYARAAGTDGPCVVLTFRCPLDEVEVYRAAGVPYFVPVWFPNIVGIVLDDSTDWDMVGELIIESYCELAPRKLAALVINGPR